MRNDPKKLVKNHNPINKPLFVVYECPNCGRCDCSIVPPVMRVNVPFFVQCDCGGWVLYRQAWITEPYKSEDIMTGFIFGDKKILNIIKYELKEVTDKLDPDGTLMDVNVMMQDPKIWAKIEKMQKEEEILKSYE